MSSRISKDGLARPLPPPARLKSAVSGPPASAAVGADADLDDPGLYLNRELTWLEFNRRVLAEAEDKQNPLLERVKFLAITGSNLDEFFMKRIGGLKLQAAPACPSQPSMAARRNNK